MDEPLPLEPRWPSQTDRPAGTSRRVEAAINRVLWSLSRHWLLVVNVLVGLFAGLGWLAPMLLAAGFEAPARVLYFLYGLTCHQFAQRSYFLFGRQAMYSLDQLGQFVSTTDAVALRNFWGTPELGYKVAYSDRMVSLYGAIFVGGLLYALARRRVRPLRLKVFFALAVVPMSLDGFSHLISDLTGWGFRDTNAWLAWLTGSALSPTFYAGDAIGSLNWWLRLTTGLVFGLAGVRLVYPYFDRNQPLAGARARAMPETPPSPRTLTPNEVG